MSINRQQGRVLLVCPLNEGTAETVLATVRQALRLDLEGGGGEERQHHTISVFGYRDFRPEIHLNTTFKHGAPKLHRSAGLLNLVLDDDDFSAWYSADGRHRVAIHDGRVELTDTGPDSKVRIHTLVDATEPEPTWWPATPSGS